jgi:DNA-binding GntR family transcriptional regulator
MVRDLLNDIAIGAMRPGDRIDEVSLAARFGVSRTPVRETINRLIGQGIVTREGGKGARVAAYRREEIAEMFEAMHEIEMVCLTLASQRLTLLSKVRIESAAADCAAATAAGDVEAYIGANDAFHHEIYQATGNRFIAEIAAALRVRTAGFRRLKLTGPHDLETSLAGHDAMMAVLEGRGDQQAVAVVRARMAEGFRRVLQGVEA